MYRSVVVALLAGLASAAHSQQNPPRKADDPSAAAPKVVHESAFAGYRPYDETEPTLARWRESNEEMRRLGGHVGHTGSTAKPPARPAVEKKK